MGRSPTDDAAAAAVALQDLLQAEPDLAALLPPGVLDAIRHYVRLLLAANLRVNLTRIVEPEAVARLHLLDSLAALPLLVETAPRTALDLGSGGGLPGIPLALARPGVRWLLVDAVGKKARELTGFAAALGLDGVEVAARRAEELGREPDQRAGHDLVTARACAPLPVLAELALPLLRTGGRLLAWKGDISDEELRGGSRAAAILGGGEPRVVRAGPAALGGHRFVVIDKERATPDRYPRRAGTPARRPLG